MFGKKEKYFILKSGHIYSFADEKSIKDKVGNVIYESNNYQDALSQYNLLVLMQDEINCLIRFIEKKDEKKDQEASLVIDNKIKTYLSTRTQDDDYIYAVQGVFPHITVSKYTKECEDSFNYCLRSETGNICVLEKGICFNTKADAVLYQNELIQKEIDKKANV